MSKRLCNRCPRRTLCRELCPEARRRLKYLEFIEDPHHVLYVGDTGTLDYLSLHSVLNLQDYHHGLNYQDWCTVKTSCRLSPRQRQCFYLYHWRRMTMREIATRIGVPHQDVNKYIQVASRKVERGLKLRYAEKRTRCESGA